MEVLCKLNYYRLFWDPLNHITQVTSLDLEKSNSSDKNIKSFRKALPKFKLENIGACTRKTMLRSGI